MSVGRAVTLDDKYRLASGGVFLTGTQALVRVPLEQLRADRARGLSTAAFVSGYQGSPLGTFDKELRSTLRSIEADIVHRPAVNEELAATAVAGSQLVPGLPQARRDGVVGVWYGKGPGLDRAADALRHANFGGTSPTGGVLALVGDDPGCKSSTLPGASEATLAALLIPTLYPGDLQEILDLGLHGIALSRATGLWSALKVVTSVADGAGTVDVAPDRVRPVAPVVEQDGKPYRHQPTSTMLAPTSLASEQTLFGVRLDIARAYARDNDLNRITHDADGAWLGLAAAGKTYRDLMQALEDLGLGSAELARAGVRILKLGMIWPLEPDIVRRFGAGLDEIVVLEEKAGFLEPALKDVLYGVARAPRVVGKRDEHGAELVPAAGELSPDIVARVVAARLRQRVQLDVVEARVAALSPALARPDAPPLLSRTPFFCSGCPHNTSTEAADDALVGAGIGCHTMVVVNRDRKGILTGLTQMGGEGAQWIGMAPFTGVGHFVQNLGDGTFHHSGSLAVRAAVAAGVNLTYKILYNDAVALTGGQAIEGSLPVPALTRWLQLEGVARTIVTTEDPGAYDGIALADNAVVRPREALMDAQRELAAVPGVTVLIHDQRCAIEKRRLRRRGQLDDPPQRVVINERVCEGCGDCGTASNCLSVLPVETEFGRKTRIHQASCNKDFSCLKGDCPSFLTVVPGRRTAASAPAPPALPEPERIVDDHDVVVRMVGIGGTGVVTVSQVLGMAAHIERRHVWALDQTGLSQKGGPVVSDVRISREPIAGTNRAPSRRADVYLGFDLLGAANPRNLEVADADRTVAVVSASAVPTGAMVLDTQLRFPAIDSALDAIERVTRREANVYLDAQALAERLFGSHMPANLVALGAAYQRGLLPLSAAAIEEALRLNRTAVETNLLAFGWGRACVSHPDEVARFTTTAPPAPTPSRETRELLAPIAGEGVLRRVLEMRVPELIAYQDRRYAQRYLATVAAVADAERAVSPGRTDLAEAVARHLFKLMAYKDEYEVARLHLSAAEQARLRAEFGDDAKVWYHLHPPLLRSLGLNRKVKLGSWFTPALRVLSAARGLRRSRLDPFGFARVRRVERALIAEYEAAVGEVIGLLRPGNYDDAVRLAGLPDMVRGYEDVKLGNVERYRAELTSGLERLRAGALTAV